MTTDVYRFSVDINPFVFTVVLFVLVGLCGFWIGTFTLATVYEARALDSGCIRFISRLSAPEVCPQDVQRIVRRLQATNSNAYDHPASWTLTDHLRTPEGDKDWRVVGFRIEYGRGSVDIKSGDAAALAVRIAEWSPATRLDTERAREPSGP